MFLWLNSLGFSEKKKTGKRSNNVAQWKIIRFYPHGNYVWTVPPGIHFVDVFLVGGGGGGASGPAGGGGFTKAFRGSGYQTSIFGTWEGTKTEGRDGNAIPVTPGQKIQIVVGEGGAPGFNNGKSSDGGFSQFLNRTFRAEGGRGGIGYEYDPVNYAGGNGGSGGAWDYFNNVKEFGRYPGSDGSDALDDDGNHGLCSGTGQGHTTRDFGEFFGKRNAGGGAYGVPGGASDYSIGSGEGTYGGSGYGGGGQATRGVGYGGKGGDGTVLVRCWISSVEFSHFFKAKGFLSPVLRMLFLGFSFVIF